MKHGPFFYALYTGVACIIIMVLLQPFGIDRVEHYKYPIIVGYAVLSAITYLLASLLTTYALRMPRREEWDFKRNIAVGLLICPIMGAFICCYSAWAYARRHPARLVLSRRTFHAESVLDKQRIYTHHLFLPHFVQLLYGTQPPACQAPAGGNGTERGTGQGKEETEPADAGRSLLRSLQNFRNPTASGSAESAASPNTLKQPTALCIWKATAGRQWN